MITEYIRYTLVAHEPADLVAAYAEAGSHLKASPECLGYELTQCVDDQRTFVLRIQWTSLKDHMEGFRGGPHFPPFLAIIRPFVPEILEMRHYQSMPEVVWRRPVVHEDR